MNLGEIRRQAILMVMRQGSEEPSPLEVDQLINRGLLEFCDRTDYLHDTVLQDLVTSQAIYTLPGTVLRVVRVALGEKVLPPVTSAELERRTPAWRTLTGTPTEYLRDLFGHNQVRVYPIPVVTGGSLQTAAFDVSQETGAIVRFSLPDTSFNQETGIIRTLTGYGADDVTDTLRIDFIKYPTTLSAEMDTPELPRQYHDCLASYAAGHLLSRSGEPKRAEPFLVEFENQVSKASREAAQTFQASIQRAVKTRYF